MLICLKTESKKLGPSQATFQITKRLPKHIVSDCTVNCNYLVRSYPGYYLLTLDVQGPLFIECQRCTEIFQYDYENETEIAICLNEKEVESLMETYDTIVLNEPNVDLLEIITDELHLYVPEKHLISTDCHVKIG